jgi:hypothetical protein
MPRNLNSRIAFCASASCCHSFTQHLLGLQFVFLPEQLKQECLLRPGFNLHESRLSSEHVLVPPLSPKMLVLVDMVVCKHSQVDI